ncbi:WD40-like beta Propeller containing protein [Pseudopedobacter saltans DSM 12145]|uniref:WD40-like beta Propeller containing protein n=1 Tax=Pseudopedobacter saltans (strain ATCC 51119 / DSM 12145 / JCM 21818 / CCUG 39354 / LMG 10337 / NBRC 100064 / NCIMB 13643) TaxID=762903 RepID=F0S5A3_PSESL|nr:DUF3748 domain-containing protein [Pseudopedobacter saltans]ADY52048.1 WD40-like beta Propeller containing protein [Pseudopedobacter saltans DSM 12145]
MNSNKQRRFSGVFTFCVVLGVIACNSRTIKMHTEKQLTFDKKGHLINHTQIFSPDGKWIVYDTRNDDTKIGSTSTIEMVNIETGEIKELYKTQNQTEFGPGVGAATFSPKEEKVIFIQGIRNASENNPYGFTRRTGVAIALENPGKAIYMDARDILPPFTPGALRGGTHAHSWSGDGEMISFTYNDYVLEQLSKHNSSVKDLRTVGVMFPEKVHVQDDNGTAENNDGQMFSVILTKVKENPKPDTDEIDKAFDECWVGKGGYIKADGKKQRKAIAFQGNVRDKAGNTKTEVFVVDLPENLTQAEDAKPLEGTSSTRPNVPKGVMQRRITFLEQGVQGPRHWLRTSKDGSKVFFLSKDKKGYINAFNVSPNGGEVNQVTFNEFDIQSGINLSPNDRLLAYVANNAVYITDLNTGKSTQISQSFLEKDKPVSAVSWSKEGSRLFYNRFVDGWMQIFSLTL